MYDSGFFIFPLVIVLLRWQEIESLSKTNETANVNELQNALSSYPHLIVNISYINLLMFKYM